MKTFARHAGIVFQIRDDILDATATAASLGKDVEQDRQKANLVRVYGVAGAEKLMQEHLEAAIQVCRALPFNTNLLQSIATYFATRRR